MTRPDAPTPTKETDNAPTTMFTHPDGWRIFIAGQANIIFQAHGPFHSPYKGTNSLLSRGEYKTSLLGTLYLGAQVVSNPKNNLDAIFDLESAGGGGDGGRGGTRPPQVPQRRLEFPIGKMGLPDFFDINNVGTDSHLQFMNWTVDNNGAWDYAADTRGYTYAATAEYDDKAWSARYALALMPTVANGINLDWNLHRASGQNGEFELRKSLLGRLLPAERKGTIRILSYVNHAHMGLYRDANKEFLAGIGTRPVIQNVEKFSAVKYGFALNFEQELTEDIRMFGRLGWNEGQHES